MQETLEDFKRATEARSLSVQEMREKLTCSASVETTVKAPARPAKCKRHVSEGT